jgi:Fe2+ or Zn2+ uptake regulation protein
MNLMGELKRGGFKATPQRALVLKVLEEGKGHMTADEIGRAVEARAVPLNRSTVYRTLETLAELGIVKATRLGRSTHYEIAAEGHEHHHLVCTSCRATVPLPIGETATALERQARAAGFQVSEIEVLVSGVCPSCREER